MGYLVNRFGRLFRTLKGEIALRTARALGREALNVGIRDGLALRVRLNDIFARTVVYGNSPEVEVESALLDVVRPGMTVLDIGANIGYYTLLLANRVGPHGRVVAFEPNPVMFGELGRNLALNGITNVQTHPLGLGDRDAEMQLVVPEPGKESHSSLRSNVTFEASGTVSVNIRTLDGLWKENSDARIDVIKCDVEGAELGVFKGAAKVLAQWKPVLIFECADNLTSAFEYSVYDALTFLVQNGYAVTQLSTGNWCARAKTARPVRAG